MHAAQHLMMSSPPEGYEFSVAPASAGGLIGVVSGWDMAYRLMRPLDNVIPTMIAKSWLQQWSHPPADTALTYAVDHLVLRPEPWMVEVEYATMMAGIHHKNLLRFKGTIERALASTYCRRILCWSEAGRETLLSNLDPEGFRHKIRMVHYAAPARSFVKEYGNGKTKLLFIGSGTAKDPFEGRGGGIFEAFAILCQQFCVMEL